MELEELITVGEETEWKERARWIKFEEDVEESLRWGKPHIPSLSFHSLLELRRGLETGKCDLGMWRSLQLIVCTVLYNLDLSAR